MTMSPEDVTRRLRAELDGMPVSERPWAAVRPALVRRRARRRHKAAAAAGAALAVIGLAVALAVVLPRTGPGHSLPGAPGQPTSAQAYGTSLTSGKPVKVSISKTSQHPKYVFAATPGKNVTFLVTHFNFTNNGVPSEVFLFYEPGSRSHYTECAVVGSTACSLKTPVGGAWSIVLDAASAGSLTLTFANDVPTKALIPGIPVTTTIKFEAQEAWYTFAATAGTNVTFNVTHFNFHSGVVLNFYEPGSSRVYLPWEPTGNSYCNFTTRVSGIWSIELQPASGGSLTLTFANEVPAKALTLGNPVTTTIKFGGQEAGYTFAATAGKNVTFNVTHFNFTDNGEFTDSGEPSKVFLAFYKPGSSSPYVPGSSSPYTECAVNRNTTCRLKAPVGGTWSITLVNDAAFGSLTIGLTS
jgi:hypothetical protein